jgi:hypothetical protein
MKRKHPEGSSRQWREDRNKRTRLERARLVKEAGSQSFLNYANRLKHTLFMRSGLVRVPRRFRRWMWVNEIRESGGKLSRAWRRDTKTYYCRDSR